LFGESDHLTGGLQLGHPPRLSAFDDVLQAIRAGAFQHFIKGRLVRDNSLARFNSGPVDILVCTVKLGTSGLDCPECDTVYLIPGSTSAA